ncbi:MAG: hypothetical protein JWR35_3680, partial [Marmoricola sp.]|nr:hypothetical protein [Marmoricola sp.]
MHPLSRTFDFCLDHRGLGPPTTPEVNLVSYIEQLSGPDGALTKWRASTYNGFYDNSILGVVGDLNKIIGPPSKDVYYFTLSFAATMAVPKFQIDLDDIFSLPESLVAKVGEWKDWLKTGGVFVDKLHDKLPASVVGRLPGSLRSKLGGPAASPAANPAPPGTSTKLQQPPPPWISGAPPAPIPGGPVPPALVPPGASSSPLPTPSTPDPQSTTSIRRFILSFLTTLFGSTLQDIATWSITR